MSEVEPSAEHGEQEKYGRAEYYGGRNVFTRINIGRAALTLGAIELAGGIASVVTGTPAWVEGGTMLNGLLAGNTIHDLHNYRHEAANTIPLPSRIFAKDAS